MKIYLKFLFQIKFIFLIILFININSKEISKEYYHNISNDIYNNSLLLGKGKRKLVENLPGLLEPGKIYKKFLTDNQKEVIKFNVLNNETKLLLINLYPPECSLNIQSKINYETIIQYTYNTYFMLIKKEEFDSSIEISPLIYSEKERMIKRRYPLIINSIELNNLTTPELYLEEKEPAFLYFNNCLKKINLIYSIKNKNRSPIIISFFIKEKVKFKIEISDGKNIITNRIINYKENIIIASDFSSEKYTITIYPIQKGVNSTLVVKIIENKSSPFPLKRDELYLGFFPKNIKYLYYYLEVFNEEEGEVFLFNKRQNGILISKIIRKGESIPDIQEFPNYDEYKNSPQKFLKFNEYNQQLSYKSTNTQECDNGCYLLISYYSNNSNYLNLIGSEFSLLNRFLDKEETKCKILNIPLNEYIFSTIKNGSFNVHYYSVYIPEDTKDISIEIQGENILAFAKKGLQQFNTMELSENTISLNNKLKTKEIINLDNDILKFDTLKGKFITFAFRSNIKEDVLAYYYFRILQSNIQNNYTIYPFDTNKINLCKTKNINGSNVCYFLLKNEYKELLNNIIVYGLGKGNITYKAFYIYDSNYYSLNLNELNSSKIIEEKNSYLNIDLSLDAQCVLIEIKSNLDEYLTVISNFKNALFQSIDIYSYQLKFLPTNARGIFNFNLDSNKIYRVFVNNINGIGYICFEEDCKYDKQRFYLNEKRIYSFSISHKIKNIYISSKENLIFNIKLSNQFTNNVMEELNYGFYLKEINPKKESFPFIFFIKDTKYCGLDINLFFNFNNSNSKFSLIIKGYAFNYEKMNDIKNKNYFKMMNMKSEFQGFYNSISNNGIIVFNNHTFNETYDNEINDKYYIILIENRTRIEEDFKLGINSISKNKNGILLPFNKYIINSFDLLKENFIMQKYYFEIIKNDTNKYIIEYSSNYNITIEFNKLIKITDSKIIGGITQYTIDFDKKINSSQWIFTIKIESNKKGNLKNVNIILKYYRKENNVTELENFIEKTYELKSIINKNKKGNNNKFNLIIKNIHDMKNLSSKKKYNFYYFLSLIKKKNKLDNEILNTTAPVSSKLKFLNKYNTSDENEELSFILYNLEINEIYIASLFMKVETNSNENEKYYSFTFEFTPKKEENWFMENIIIIIIFVFIIIIIIIVILFFVICSKIKKKNEDLREKIRSISFSNGLAEDIENESNISNSKNDKDYEYTFI